MVGNFDENIFPAYKEGKCCVFYLIDRDQIVKIVASKIPPKFSDSTLLT